MPLCQLTVSCLIFSMTIKQYSTSERVLRRELMPVLCEVQNGWVRGPIAQSWKWQSSQTSVCWLHTHLAFIPLFLVRSSGRSSSSATLTQPWPSLRPHCLSLPSTISPGDWKSHMIPEVRSTASTTANVTPPPPPLLLLLIVIKWHSHFARACYTSSTVVSCKYFACIDSFNAHESAMT